MDNGFATIPGQQNSGGKRELRKRSVCTPALADVGLPVMRTRTKSMDSADPLWVAVKQSHRTRHYLR